MFNFQSPLSASAGQKSMNSPIDWEVQDWLLKNKWCTSNKDVGTAKQQKIGRQRWLYTELFSIIPTLFHHFCCSAIPTSCYIFKIVVVCALITKWDVGGEEGTRLVTCNLPTILCTVCGISKPHPLLHSRKGLVKVHSAH